MGNNEAIDYNTKEHASRCNEFVGNTAVILLAVGGFRSLAVL